MERYGDRAKLEVAWTDAPTTDTGGPNLLTNGGFEDGLTRWTPNVNDGIEATFEIITDDVIEGSNALKINVTNGGGTWCGNAWLSYSGTMSIEKGKWYTIGFWAKSDAPNLGGTCSNWPYQFLIGIRGESEGLKSGSNNMIYIDSIDDGNPGDDSDWKYYQTSFIANKTATNAGFRFISLAYKNGIIWMDNVTLRKGNVYGLRSWEDPALNNTHRLQMVDQFGFSVPRYRDTVQFYVDMQRNFTDGVENYLIDNVYTDDRSLPPISGS
ncbi:carbohydrate binding domain-containing protein, partial [bacterium]|nr:carbohydrate binding domain-containing protein [bacterium]